jgi:hypothetical protein
MERLGSSADEPRAGGVIGETVSRLDCIYVTASSRDARHTRICVASIRYFYPGVAIRLLIGGRLEPGLIEELARYWSVTVADISEADWGWGFVKLEPLFRAGRERFMVLDSDTVFCGKVLEAWNSSAADFLVDDEKQTETKTHELYYDWRKVAAIDSTAAPPQFVFNSGQWFGTSGILSRDDFAQLIVWNGRGPKLQHPQIFMCGEQGALNYLFNQKVRSGQISVDRRQIMRWPGHGMDGINTNAVAERSAPPLVVHWAGMKSFFLRSLVGADLLQFFETFYYSRLPGGRLRWAFALCRHVWIQYSFFISLRLRLRHQKWFGWQGEHNGSRV